MRALDRSMAALVILLAAALWIAHLLNLIPLALADLLSRAAPALLIALGLALLLGRRARYGNLIALGVTFALVGGVAAISFNREASLFREDYVESLEYTLPPNVVSIRLSAALRRTEVALRAAEGRTLSGEFSRQLREPARAELPHRGRRRHPRTARDSARGVAQARSDRARTASFELADGCEHREAEPHRLSRRPEP